MLWSCRSGLSRSGWGQRSTSPTTSHMMLRALVSGPHREPRGAGQVPEFSFTYVCYKAFHACSQMCILDNLEDDFSWFFTLYTGVAVEQWRFLSEDTWKPSLQRFSGMCLSYQERRKEGKKKRRNKGRRGGRKEGRKEGGREGREMGRKEGRRERRGTFTPHFGKSSASPCRPPCLMSVPSHLQRGPSCSMTPLSWPELQNQGWARHRLAYHMLPLQGIWKRSSEIAASSWQVQRNSGSPSWSGHLS